MCQPFSSGFCDDPNRSEYVFPKAFIYLAHTLQLLDTKSPTVSERSEKKHGCTYKSITTPSNWLVAQIHENTGNSKCDSLRVRVDI